MFANVEGGICAPKGFSAAGHHCGIRQNTVKKDLALIFSEVPAAAAAVYTQNKVKGAPILVTQKHIANGIAQAYLCNSGNANTCNADGEYVAVEMCKAAAKELHIAPEDIIIASTGVIGVPLNLQPILEGMPELAGALDSGSAGNWDAAEAIMTTDTKVKQRAVTFELAGVTCTLGGICKGSGMIMPNMATMLAVLTTDAAIDGELLQTALKTVVDVTFNMVSVDGDTSTNDMLAVMANGLAGNPKITATGADYDTFVGAMTEVCTQLAREIAADGEGATKLLECVVTGAPDWATARIVAKAVINSTLFKAALFGADANWGRVLCAIGYADAAFDIAKVGVVFASKAGTLRVCENGAGVPFSEDAAKKLLLEDEIQVTVEMSQGSECAKAWGCDLTYDYVKINGDYRT